MAGSYMENLEKLQNCQNLGVDACVGVGACPGQYGTSFQLSLNMNMYFPGFSLGLFQRALCPLVPLMCPLGLPKNQ